MRGWVSDDWKLVQGADTELFDLKADPREERNLAAQEPARVELASVLSVAHLGDPETLAVALLLLMMAAFWLESALTIQRPGS